MGSGRAVVGKKLGSGTKLSTQGGAARRKMARQVEWEEVGPEGKRSELGPKGEGPDKEEGATRGVQRGWAQRDKDQDLGHICELQ